MASELRDSEEMITFNRPEADITIVMIEGDTATEQAMVQASILACNHDTPEVCTNIINLNEGEQVFIFGFSRNNSTFWNLFWHVLTETVSC